MASSAESLSTYLQIGVIMTKGNNRSGVDQSESLEAAVLKQEIAEAYLMIDQVQSQIVAVQDKVDKLDDIPKKMDNREGMMKSMMT